MRIIVKPGMVIVFLLIFVTLIVIAYRNQSPSNQSVKKEPLDPHLVAHWDFDESSGAIVGDSAENSRYSGTLKGDASRGSGLVGTHSLILSGDNSFVDVPKPVIDTTHSFTVAACVKLNSLSRYQTAVSIDGEKVSGFYLQLRQESGKFAFSCLPTDDSKGVPIIAGANDTPQVKRWYHLTGVYDSTAHSITLYVDGIQVQRATLSSSWSAHGHTAIGRAMFDGNPVDFIDGQVDDVRFYDTVLSAEEIRALAESDLTAGPR